MYHIMHVQLTIVHPGYMTKRQASHTTQHMIRVSHLVKIDKALNI